MSIRRLFTNSSPCLAAGSCEELDEERLKSVIVSTHEWCACVCVCLSHLMNRVSIHMLVEQSYCRVQATAGYPVDITQAHSLDCVCELIHIAAVVHCCCMVVVNYRFLLCSLQCCVCMCVCVFSL